MLGDFPKISDHFLKMSEDFLTFVTRPGNECFPTTFPEDN